MKIEFIDPAPQQSKITCINVNPNGEFKLSVGFVRQMGLKVDYLVELVVDKDAQEFYMVFGPISGRTPAKLRASNQKKLAGALPPLMYRNAAQAARLFATFEQGDLASFTLPLSTSPVVHDGLKLYLLDTSKLTRKVAVTPVDEQPAPVAPVAPDAPAPPASTEEMAPAPVVEETTPVVVAPEAAAPATTPAPVAMAVVSDEEVPLKKGEYSEEEKEQLRREFSTVADVKELAARMNRPVGPLVQKAYHMGLKRDGMPASPKAEEVAKPAPRPAKRQAGWVAPTKKDPSDNWKPAPTKEKGQQLSSYWKSREFAEANDSDIIEVIDVLSALKEEDTGIWEKLVLDRAQLEHKRRNLHLKKKAA